MANQIKVRASQVIKMLVAEKRKVQEINRFLLCFIEVLKNYRDTHDDPVMLLIPARLADRDKEGNPDPCCGWCIDNMPPSPESLTLRSSRKPNRKK